MPLGQLARREALAQELLPAGMQVPPGGWHLDGEPRVPQEVNYFAVGIGVWAKGLKGRPPEGL